MSNHNPALKSAVEQDTKVSSADDRIQTRIRGVIKLTEQELERVSGGTRTKSSEVHANLHAEYYPPHRDVTAITSLRFPLGYGRGTASETDN